MRGRWWLQELPYLTFRLIVYTIKTVRYTWDENKREINLTKHRLDFADAHLVYENPEKLTFSSRRQDEPRDLDIAFVRVMETVLALVYHMRGEDVHVISFRYASRKERRIYEQQRNEESHRLGICETNG